METFVERNMMPLRPIARKSKTGKVTSKKYAGVLERYRASDGKTTGYYISYRDADSKACKHSVEALTRDDALLQLNQIKAEVKRAKARGENVKARRKSYTIDELAALYFTEKKSNANNKKEKQRYANHLEPIVGDIKAINLLPKHITTIQDSMTLAPKSINLATDLLRSIIGNALSNNDIHRDGYTMHKYKKLQVDNRAEKTLTPDEIQALIKGIKKSRLKLFIVMAYFTAQRPESLLRLQVKDICGTHIAISAIKKQKSHEIKIHSKIKPILDAWIKDNELKSDDYIFFGANGKHKGISYERLQKETSDLFAPFNTGLDYKDDRKKWVSLYTLRHSAATQMLRNTKSLKAVGKVLNHSDQRVTQRYADALDEEKDEAIGGL